MKKFKLNANEMLQRSELKSVVGGSESVCDSGSSIPITIDCGDGFVAHYNGCAEHLEAWNDFADELCAS